MPSARAPCSAPSTTNNRRAVLVVRERQVDHDGGDFFPSDAPRARGICAPACTRSPVTRRLQSIAVRRQIPRGLRMLAACHQVLTMLTGSTRRPFFAARSRCSLPRCSASPALPIRHVFFPFPATASSPWSTSLEGCGRLEVVPGTKACEGSSLMLGLRRWTPAGPSAERRRGLANGSCRNSRERAASTGLTRANA